jgi:hypothetical protein
MEDQSMAKQTPAASEVTPSGYFRRILSEDPKLLKGRNNETLLNRWLADHPGEKRIPKNIRSILSNVKSVLRSKRRRRKAAKAEAGPQAVRVGSPNRPKVKKNWLEILEERIDEVLDMAKGLAVDGLEEVIRLLRRARNEVVWKMGQ